MGDAVIQVPLWLCLWLVAGVAVCVLVSPYDPDHVDATGGRWWLRLFALAVLAAPVILATAALTLAVLPFRRQ